MEKYYKEMFSRVQMRLLIIALRGRRFFFSPPRFVPFGVLKDNNFERIMIVFFKKILDTSARHKHTHVHQTFMHIKHEIRGLQGRGKQQRKKRFRRLENNGGRSQSHYTPRDKYTSVVRQIKHPTRKDKRKGNAFTFFLLGLSFFPVSLG